MKIFSLAQNNMFVQPIEIEVSLQPGLPIITILGQPDFLTKESIPKIHAALRAQGFDLPRAQKIIVNLKPQNIRKSNEGLELAIAAAILVETKQIRLDRSSAKDWLVFGDLSLKGEVLVPSQEFSHEPFSEQFEFLCASDQETSAAVFRVRKLSDLRKPMRSQPRLITRNAVRPSLKNLKFPKSAAKLLAIIAAGEHHAMIAGPAGTGKSTLIAQVNSLLEAPDEEALRQIERAQTLNQMPVNHWRPEIDVHHSATTTAMLGGGGQVYSGELARARHGVLLMNEFYLFHSEIIESLREPMENSHLTIARAGQVRKFVMDFILLATTNLCSCGKHAPVGVTGCTCPALKLKNYIHRVSGPIMDRFQILAFSSDWDSSDKTKTLDQIFAEVETATIFRKQTRGQKKCNASLVLSDFPGQTELVQTLYSVQDLSDRRLLALMRVARTIADLEESIEVKPWHYKASQLLTVASFHWLENAQRGAG